MEAKTQRVLIITMGLIALAGVGFFFYSQQKTKKEAKILEESVNDMTQQYDIFN
jgi:hypothetical protein